MSDHVEQFIDDILDRWPPTHAWTDERKAKWCQDLAENLGSEKPEILKWALKLLVANRNFGSTPLVAEVLKAVNQAVKEIGAQRRAGMLKLEDGDTYDRMPWDPPEEQRTWRKERIKLAYDLLPTEAGRQAAREGWVKPYWEYIVTYGKAPPASEYARLKAAAITMDYCQEILRRGHPLAKQIVEAAKYRMADADRLAEIAHGKRMPSRQEYWQQQFGGVPGGMATAHQSPPSRYADENLEEGRGNLGVTA